MQTQPEQPHQSHSELCQIVTAQDASRLRRPGWLYVPSRILSNLRQRGLVYTFRATVKPRVAALRVRLGGPKPVLRTPECDDAILDLQPGELVEVKSLEDIQKTLDAKGRNRGLIFTPELRQHCGKRYRVFKRLELMCSECNKAQRRVKHTVLLENVVCTGAGIGCDRSCFLYWREVWLRRVEE